MNKKELIKKLRRDRIKEEILKAMEEVDRKDFVSKENLNQVYENHPLSIGYGQTISQPSTVAFMLQELELKEGDKVLEVGTGSGWNTALISCLVGNKGKVYSVEIVKELAESAKEKLKNYKNVFIFNTNASNGFNKCAPYDKIILTAAPQKIAEEFKNQLAPGGILLAPVGEFIQKLIKIIKKGDQFIETEKGDFIFVPLISEK